VLIALLAIQGAANYFILVFLLYIKLKLPLAHRTGQNIHQFLFHGSIIPHTIIYLPKLL